uniref:Uncharacterized protein n=1 Tax=Anguilla anguilla TaxID=7936 RepID=A0A0E9WRN6_ANGAN
MRLTGLYVSPPQLRRWRISLYSRLPQLLTHEAQSIFFNGPNGPICDMPHRKSSWAFNNPFDPF